MSTQTGEEQKDSTGYAEMLAEYEQTATWIGPADLPLVFHLRKLCAQLDAAGLDKAALSSAYLQAFSRLDKRRPGAKPDHTDPHQTSIFDELD